VEKKARMVNISRTGLKLSAEHSSSAENRMKRRLAGQCKMYHIIKLPSEVITFLIISGGKEVSSFTLPISKCTLEASLPHTLRLYASTDIPGRTKMGFIGCHCYFSKLMGCVSAKP